MAAAAAPLQALAQKHAGGAAAYARVVAQDLLEGFLATEERFSGGATDQEVIDFLRQVRCGAHLHPPRLPAPACNRHFASCSGRHCSTFRLTSSGLASGTTSSWFSFVSYCPSYGLPFK